MFDLRNVKTNDEIMVRDKDDEQWIVANLLCIVGDLCFVRATKNSTAAKGFKQAKKMSVNWEEIPAGKPIIVWNDEREKFVREFAFEKNGKIYVRYENERSFWEYDNAELIDEYTYKSYWEYVPVGTKCLFRNKREGQWVKGPFLGCLGNGEFKCGIYDGRNGEICMFLPYKLCKVDYSKENE